MPTSDFKAQIGREIARRRQERGLSQRELAEEVGCDVSTIARVETGHRGLSLDLLYEVAKQLRVPMAALLPDTPNEGVSPTMRSALAVLREQDRELVERLAERLAQDE